MRKSIVILFILFTSLNIYAQSEQGNPGSSKINIFSTVFGDYFYKAGGDSTGNQLQYTPYNKEFNAFAFRRVYVGFDYSINESFQTRLGLSYDGPDTLPDGNISVYIKDAYVNWKDIFKNANLTFGIMPTIGFSYTIEKYWGYRSIEKTIMDQRGILNSRDFGLMLSGTFDDSKDFGYYSMISNGTGSRLENNKYKKVSGMLFGNFFDKKMTADFYSDYSSSGNNQSKTTLSAFAGYSNDVVTLGAESFFQIQNNFNTTPGAVSPDIVPFGFSFFIDQIYLYDELKFFFRYDFYNQDINNPSTGYYQSFLTAGFDFFPQKNVHFMPNIWLNAYTAKPSQTSLTTDVVPRITFWYDYK